MADSSDATDADDSAGDDAPESESESIGLVAARDRAIEAAGELLEYEFEGVVRVENQSEGWRVLVEVVEREAVPDTQDIIGRYEVELDDAGDLTGYGLIERYRRGEMKEEL